MECLQRPTETHPYDALSIIELHLSVDSATLRWEHRDLNPDQRVSSEFSANIRLHFQV